MTIRKQFFNGTDIVISNEMTSNDKIDYIVRYQRVLSSDDDCANAYFNCQLIERMINSFDLENF